MSCKLVPDKLTVELRRSALGSAVTGGGREVVFVAGQKRMGERRYVGGGCRVNIWILGNRIEQKSG